MARDVKVIVGKAPQGAIDLAEYEQLDDFVDDLKDALAGGRVAQAWFRPPRVDGKQPFSLPDAMAGLVEVASAEGAGPVSVFVEKADTAKALERELQPTSDGRRTWAFRGWKVVLRAGDLVAVRAEALVNASNGELRLGSGISGALRVACGPGLQQEMDRHRLHHGRLDSHGIAVTGAHDLEMHGVRRILHVPTASGKADVVKAALANVLEKAEALGLRTVAIPGLGTGTGGLAMETFAALCVDALREGKAPSTERTLVFVAYPKDQGAFGVMERAFDAALLPASA